MDDRHRRARSRRAARDPLEALDPLDAILSADPAPGTTPALGRSTHAWAAVVARFGGQGGSGDPDEPGARGETSSFVVVWWETPAGAQPVILRRRIRLE